MESFEDYEYCESCQYYEFSDNSLEYFQNYECYEDSELFIQFGKIKLYAIENDYQLCKIKFYAIYIYFLLTK